MDSERLTAQQMFELMNRHNCSCKPDDDVGCCHHWANCASYQRDAWERFSKMVKCYVEVANG